MGLEAETICTHSGKSHAVKALLESTELILRGDLKRKLPLVSLTTVRASNKSLSFNANGESYSLALSADKAATWAKKITSPPPLLAKKLGISAEALAFVLGKTDDAELDVTIKDNTTRKPTQAAVFIAVVRSEAELNAALKAYGKAKAPLWLINVKGQKSALGENAIRDKLRALGFKDTKTCAVSATLSGTRYNRPK
jgi:hypothetical protein